MAEKITPCLWFDRNALEAAQFWTGLIPDSRIDAIHRAASDFPDGGKEGVVVLVDFTLAGRPYQGLNGGPQFQFDEAVSLVIDCADQAEVDRYWNALLDGGTASQCGWLKDRFGFSWQIVPRALNEMLASPDRGAARRAMEAMLAMVKLDVAALRAAFEGKAVA